MAGAKDLVIAGKISIAHGNVHDDIAALFTYSIGNFPTLRCLEQIRNDCAYHQANVKIVCIGGPDLKEVVPGYLAVLAEANPQAVGGALPADDFYYTGE